MKNKTVIIPVTIIIVNVIVYVGITHWRAQNQERVRIMLRDATRYAGATGPAITGFDNSTNRWIAEMEEESTEELVRKLVDYAEYMSGILMATQGGSSFTDEGRESMYHRPVFGAILSNRRFRAAYERLQNTNKREAAELLSTNIRDHLTVLRTMLQEDTGKASRGDFDEAIGFVAYGKSPEGTYRPMACLDTLPTRFARKYAVFSYIWLASLLKLREVRPAIEDVIQLAKEEYALFNSVEVDISHVTPENFADFLRDRDIQQKLDFKRSLLSQSLYNPSLLLTATLCDPTWNVDKHKQLGAKLDKKEVVDFRARALEQDRYARIRMVPVVPHDGTLTIRHYKGITDAEFNAFFGK